MPFLPAIRRDWDSDSGPWFIPAVFTCLRGQDWQTIQQRPFLLHLGPAHTTELQAPPLQNRDEDSTLLQRSLGYCWFLRVAMKCQRTADFQYTGLSWDQKFSIAMNYLDLASQFCPSDSLTLKKLEMPSGKHGTTTMIQDSWIASWWLILDIRMKKKKPSASDAEFSPHKLELCKNTLDAICSWYSRVPCSLKQGFDAPLCSLSSCLWQAHTYKCFHMSGTGTPEQVG